MDMKDFSNFYLLLPMPKINMIILYQIQWPSVHTGKTFKEHNIFRLGDAVNSTDDEIFEQVERTGWSVE